MISAVVRDIVNECRYIDFLPHPSLSCLDRRPAICAFTRIVGDHFLFTSCSIGRRHHCARNACKRKDSVSGRSLRSLALQTFLRAKHAEGALLWLPLAPAPQIVGIRSNTEQICRNKSKLRRLEGYYADHCAVRAGQHPPLPMFPSQEVMPALGSQLLAGVFAHANGPVGRSFSYFVASLPLCFTCFHEYTSDTNSDTHA